VSAIRNLICRAGLKIQEKSSNKYSIQGEKSFEGVGMGKLEFCEWKAEPVLTTSLRASLNLRVYTKSTSEKGECRAGWRDKKGKSSIPAARHAEVLGEKVKVTA